MNDVEDRFVRLHRLREDAQRWLALLELIEEAHADGIIKEHCLKKLEQLARDLQKTLRE
jgi:transcription initiation factor IIE alpha subunit